MMARRSVRILLVVTVLAASGACGPGTTPAGQPPMAQITRESVEGFREAFNRASDQARIVLLLSPT